MLALSSNAAKNLTKSRKANARHRGGLVTSRISVTVAELATAQFAAAKWTGSILACSNGNAGSACLVYSNGSAWKVIALGATAAAS